LNNIKDHCHIMLWIAIALTAILFMIANRIMGESNSRTSRLERQVEQLEHSMIVATTSTSATTRDKYDINGDGLVDALDLLLIKQELLKSSPITPEQTQETTQETTMETTIIEDEQIPVVSGTALVPSKTITFVGIFETTAYCSCVHCCGKSDGITASGTKVQVGRTIAADPKMFAYGTKLIVEGMGEYIVEDCGSFRGKRLDIYFNSHKEALIFGRKHLKVYIVKP
jgi:3D (Asp-Asp-Asp) domain-containing protein